MGGTPRRGHAVTPGSPGPGGPTDPGGSTGTVGASWAAVVAARRALRDARVGSPDIRRTRAAQQAYLAALEAYAGALAAAGLPVPYQVRDEVALYRALGTAGYR